MVEGVEGVSCEEQLRIPGLVSLDRRRLRGHLIAVYNFLVMGNAEGGAALFSQQALLVASPFLLILGPESCFSTLGSSLGCLGALQPSSV
ncbi:hypothetical protein QYF61_021470 [Mycteria americana]|uniref:Uncharacterized protein n=1 Tax=Mycteria americana TaxID=33587 RepID=A0AAN7RQ31_MYCAM|nr:hypothetical protein QYF61_021470 [Mycteria americana]